MLFPVMSFSSLTIALFIPHSSAKASDGAMDSRRGDELSLHTAVTQRPSIEKSRHRNIHMLHQSQLTEEVLMLVFISVPILFIVSFFSLQPNYTPQRSIPLRRKPPLHHQSMWESGLKSATAQSLSITINSLKSV